MLKPLVGLFQETGELAANCQLDDFAPSAQHQFGGDGAHQAQRQGKGGEGGMNVSSP